MESNMPMSFILICGIGVICGYVLMIRGDRRRQIVKHTTHLHPAFKIVKRDRFLCAARHPVWTTWREVAARRQISRAWHSALNSLEPFFFSNLRSREFGNGSQQPLGIRMLGPREQFLD